MSEERRHLPAHSACEPVPEQQSGEDVPEVVEEPEEESETMQRVRAQLAEVNRTRRPIPRPSGSVLTGPAALNTWASGSYGI
ncbi:hypothetical protein ACFYNO_33650 [Kitasatospora sp. NPDC006697]|uniref:hypothetical protein n=1 Tax=Kitasatospora sp. NPDC006697 TaxID=3364020 RepID=UPI0036A30851